eukprot:365378-Chlamydomonas_euryale.AAC.10
MDCTRSQAYTENLPVMPKMTQLRIYRYELPWTASAGVGTRWEEGQSDFMHVGSLYSAFTHFFNQLCKDLHFYSHNARTFTSTLTMQQPSLLLSQCKDLHFYSHNAGTFTSTLTMNPSCDWAVRTENPYEANLFYVPLFAYTAWSNVGDPRSNVQHVMEYIQAAYPEV